MVKFQKFNKRIKAWVILKQTSAGISIENVKQKKPMIKFKGVPVRRRK